MLLEGTAQKRGRTRFGDGRWQIALAKLEAVRCEPDIRNKIPEILGLKIRQSVLDASKIDHPDRFEITEVFHYADHNIDDVGPDHRGEDPNQRAASAA